MFGMHRLRLHRVVPQDRNLAVISQHYYGTPNYALVIYQHNRDVIQSPNVIFPGQSLVIPHIPNC